jgi:hypothetical protein
MRKVVQILQGLKEEIPYSSAHSTTHGIFRKEGKTKPYVIEISQYGVYYWPLQCCEAAEKSGTDFTGGLPYLPVAVSELPEEDRKTLLRSPTTPNKVCRLYKL